MQINIIITYIQLLPYWWEPQQWPVSSVGKGVAQLELWYYQVGCKSFQPLYESVQQSLTKAKHTYAFTSVIPPLATYQTMSISVY